MLSTRSALLILREAFYGTTRFDDFAERVGISEPVTAARLRELVDEGLLEREDYREPGQRTRQQYRLTEKGADLFPVLVALMKWGDRWLDDRGGPIELLHRDCGEPVGRRAALRRRSRSRVGRDRRRSALPLALGRGLRRWQRGRVRGAPRERLEHGGFVDPQLREHRGDLLVTS